MEVEEGKREWTLSELTCRVCYEVTMEEGSGQELQKLLLWAPVADWSQGVLLWDPGNTVHIV